MSVELDGLVFVPSRITQLRANHSRVPRQICGLGLAMDLVVPGVRFWIFDQPRNGSEEFYWMHTNIIVEIQRQDHKIFFQTASRSIYQVDYCISRLVFEPNRWQLFLMVRLVKEDRQILGKE